MMTPDQILALEHAAAAAVGKPEMRCQHALASIYFEAGILKPFVVPDGARSWGRSQGDSLFTKFIESCGFFDVVNANGETGAAAIALAQPGDLLGFRLCLSVHHIAIALEGGRIVHAFDVHGIKIGPCIPTNWAPRVEKVWRPRT